MTLKDVAALAGVSRSAVSRTFTDGASVSVKTREKVEAAAQTLGYTPSLIASSLTTGRTKLIGLIANNFQNPVFMDVFDLFTRALQTSGYRPLLVNLTDETDPAHSVQMLKQYNVDGVIVATSTLPVSFSRAFRQAKLRVVHAFGRYDAVANIDVVGIDNWQCGRMAAQSLLARGYKSIAILGGPETATSTQDRVAGFCDHMRQSRIKVSDISYADSYTQTAGVAAMQKLLARVKVDAVFCGDDLVCIGAIDAARQQGLRIPEDIGFLGFNDIQMAAWGGYNLTTIHQPIDKIINCAVETLLSLDDDEARRATTQLFECRIVERGTLRPTTK